jgi:UDP-2-acetamido-3-amino-2,3-dideoxy-glucuronate N-acetyltransferase
MPSQTRPPEPMRRGERVFLHPQALVESSSIGEGTRVSAFVHILPGARIGRDCNILDYTFIENEVLIGDRVTIQGGVQLWNGVEVEDDVTIGANASFAGGSGSTRTTLKRGASIGANATVLRNIVIGERAVIAAGTVVTHNVPANAIVNGNPAQIVGYSTASLPSAAAPVAPDEAVPLVRGVILRQLPCFEDMRGALTVAEIQQQVPFAIQRLYLVHDVPNREVRGEHAHRTLHQFLICAHGGLTVTADDGEHRQEFILDTPGRGLYLPPLTWSVQSQYSTDAVLLVLASAAYDPGDYVRDYAEFLRLLRFCAGTEPRP